MFTGKRIVYACVAIALAAATSFAGENDRKDIQQVAYSTARRGKAATRPHRVTIWRGGTPSLASAQLDPDDPADVPPMPPNAPNGFVPDPIGPSDDVGSPFLDEAGHDHGSSGSGGCADGSCDGSCDCGSNHCAQCSGCAAPWWVHRSFLFGQYLLLHPSGVDVAHAMLAEDGGLVPAGQVGTVDQDYTSAYAAGFGIALNACSSIQTSYTNFHSHNTDALAAPGISGVGVRSLVLHPSSGFALSPSFLLQATSDIDYQLVDVDYRRLLTAGCQFALNYSVGARYAKLTQDFQQFGVFIEPPGAILTRTGINFEGGGLKAGLDGMQRLGNTRFGVYGQGALGLIFGTFDSNYLQLETSTATVQAASSWSDERVVPILELEVGLNFTSHNGRWRASAGYYTAFWFNTIATPEYVQAVQTADFVGLGETIAFDGLVSRLEFRF
jgi:hypothetical protein